MVPGPNPLTVSVEYYDSLSRYGLVKHLSELEETMEAAVVDRLEETIEAIAMDGLIVTRHVCT